MNKNYKTLAQIILNITFISTIIGVLFFTYGKDVEKLIVKQQSEYIAESMANDSKIFFPKNIRQSIANSITVPDMNKADSDAEKTNDSLKKKAMIVLGILCFIGIIITCIVCWYGKVNKKHVFIEATIILCFAVATEVLFLNVIARNYKSADPNFVKLQILKSIKNNIG